MNQQIKETNPDSCSTLIGTSGVQLRRENREFVHAGTREARLLPDPAFPLPRALVRPPQLSPNPSSFKRRPRRLIETCKNMIVYRLGIGEDRCTGPATCSQLSHLHFSHKNQIRMFFSTHLQYIVPTFVCFVSYTVTNLVMKSVRILCFNYDFGDLKVHNIDSQILK